MAEPSITTIKKLFALSSNRCAFPGCPNPLILDGVLIGRVCHICADKRGGKRYDRHQTENERQGFENLILLCANHHIVIDDDEIKYSVPVLHQMKHAHEQKAVEPFVIGDDAARRIITFMAGGVVGGVLVDVVRELKDFVQLLRSALPAPAQSKPTTSDQSKEKTPDDHAKALVQELLEVLRYGPKGKMLFQTDDPAHKELGSFFADLFSRAGWIVLTPSRAELQQQLSIICPDPGPFLLLWFFLRDPNQVSNAQQTIDHILSRCGFVLNKRPIGAKYTAEDNRLRIFFLVQASRWV